MFEDEKSRDVESSSPMKSASMTKAHHCETRSRPSLKRACFWTGITIAAACALCHYYLTYATLSFGGFTLHPHKHHKSKSQCPQPSKGLLPNQDQNHAIHNKLLDKYQTDDFLHEAIETLSKAVQIPTESGDDYGPVGEDSRWDIFMPFQNYLRQRFPLVHSTMSLEKVNTYGLVFSWSGADTSLKPLVLVAHQDVVPVNPDTIDEWEHPPYSGYYDGEVIWGRGSSDDKSGLMGILSALENLIEQGFKPTRTILVTSGFDEECSGIQGARSIVDHLLEIYGPDSLAMVIDEGGGFGPQYGMQVAMPNVGEKGYTDVQITVQTPGGHSSVPPAHSSIGILADLITTIEKNPFKPRLTKASSIYDTVSCIAEHAPDSFSRKLRKAIQKDSLKKAVDLLLEEQPSFLPLLRTTTAVDIISGGVKVNALPEGASAIVNHRIAVDSSIAEVQEYYKTLLSPSADKFNLSFLAFGEDLKPQFESTEPNRILTLKDAFGHSTEPVPKAPTFGSPAWDVLAGTIVSSFQAFRKHEEVKDDNGILVVPSMSTGNTDVRYYGELTKNIYRYIHKGTGGSSRLGNVHTVNESMSAKAFVEMIGFFTTLVLNMDEATSL